MIKIFGKTALIAAALALSTVTPALADDHQKELKGKALCAKCELKKSDKCETLIEAKQGDETKTYHLVANDVAKDFHSKICSAPKEVVAKGEVKEKDGKRYITLSKIEPKKAE